MVLFSSNVDKEKDTCTTLKGGKNYSPLKCMGSMIILITGFILYM